MKSRERYRESSSFFNNFTEMSKLPRFAQEGGGAEFRQGLRVVNGNTNRLLSLMI